MYSFKDEKGDELFLMRKYVLVEMEKVSEKTEGGIYLPDSAKDIAQGKVDKGKIVCIGKDVTAIDLGLPDDIEPIRVGDIVFVHRYAGIELEIDKKPHKIVPTEDIYACLRKKEENNDNSN
jgi:co-chaperonin GroES (HSP10)